MTGGDRGPGMPCPYDLAQELSSLWVNELAIRLKHRLPP